MAVSNSITIRPIAHGDWAEWLRLRRALWPQEAPVDLRREMQEIAADDGQPVFVAAHPDGSLCGMVEVAIRFAAEGCKTDRIGYLEGLYVDPEHRRCGVGRRLVQAAETWARTQGCTEMASDTTPEYPLSPDAHQALGYVMAQQTIHFCKRLD